MKGANGTKYNKLSSKNPRERDSRDSRDLVYSYKGKRREDDLRITEEENSLVNKMMLSKALKNKNSRTLSLDLTHSLCGRRSNEGYYTHKNKPHQNYTTEKIENDAVTDNKFSSLFKDFTVQHKKKFRTNSIALHHMTDYNDFNLLSNNNSNVYSNILVPSTTKENNYMSSNSTKSIFAKNIINKNKTGNGSNFSKYLSVVNKSKAENSTSNCNNRSTMGVKVNQSINFNSSNAINSGIQGIQGFQGNINTRNVTSLNNDLIPGCSIQIKTKNFVAENNILQGNNNSNTTNNNIIHSTHTNTNMNQTISNNIATNSNLKNETNHKKVNSVKKSANSSVTRNSKLKVNYPFQKYSVSYSNTGSNSANNNTTKNSKANSMLQSLQSTPSMQPIITGLNLANFSNLNNLTIGKPPQYKANSLNISQDYTRKTSRTQNEVNEDETEIEEAVLESPLTNETKTKLNEIKQAIIELMNNSQNKNKILKELENIYKYVLKVNSHIATTSDDDNLNSVVRKSQLSSTNSFTNSISCNFNVSNIKSSKRGLSDKEVHSIDIENEGLKKENENLKSKMEVIDQKFDHICNENRDLKSYVKAKTDNIEDLRTVLKTFQGELNEMKKQSNYNNQNTLMNTNTNNNGIITNGVITNGVITNGVNSNAHANNKINNCNSVLSKLKLSNLGLNNKNLKNIVSANMFIETLSDKVDTSIDDNKNLSIDQISNNRCSDKNFSCIDPINNNKFNFHLMPKLKFDEKEEESADGVADNERTGCFADMMNKRETEEVYEEDPYNKDDRSDFLYEDEISVDFDSLNRMNEIIEKEKLLGKNKINMNVTHNITANAFHSNNNIQNLNVINVHEAPNKLKGKSFSLNFSSLPREDFNDEFMQNYKDFSPSWRKEVEKINLSKFNFFKKK